MGARRQGSAGQGKPEIRPGRDLRHRFGGQLALDHDLIREFFGRLRQGNLSASALL